MSEQFEIPAIVKVRKAGAKGGSLLITIPKEIVELLELNDGDFVQIKVSKIKLKKVETET